VKRHRYGRPIALRFSRARRRPFADAAAAEAGDDRHMCLGIPGQVVEHLGDGLARIDVSGVRRDVSIAFTPGVEPGDWVLVHVGFALAQIDEEEARATLELLAEAIAAELDPVEPSNRVLQGSFEAPR
jgi:hydrogenase expression/formation protein HypC